MLAELEIRSAKRGIGHIAALHAAFNLLCLTLYRNVVVNSGTHLTPAYICHFYRVTRRHRSHDCSTQNIGFSVGG